MQLEHTLHKSVAVDQFHFDLPIKKSLTQALGPKLPDIVEEGKLAVEEFIGVAKGRSLSQYPDISLTYLLKTGPLAMDSRPASISLLEQQIACCLTFP